MNRKSFLKTGIISGLVTLFSPKLLANKIDNDSKFDEYYKYLDKNEFEIFETKNGDLIIVDLKSKEPHVVYHKTKRYGLHLTPNQNQRNFINQIT